jgi:hypothetical protein
VIPLRLLASYEDHSISFSTKAVSLSFHMPMVQRLAKARAKPIGSGNSFASVPKVLRESVALMIATIGLPAQGRVILSISDQGVGVTPDDSSNLAAGHSEASAIRPLFPGPVWFWIASTFVRATGGTVDISSRGQGQETTASIALPGSPMKTSELMALADE